MSIKSLLFDVFYKVTKPPWLIEQAQPDLITTADNGEVRGPTILDVGCGSGDNAIFLAKRGFEVTAVDFSAKAISIAKERAADAEVSVAFMTLDALKIGTLDARFDTVIDFGLFHNIGASDRGRYVHALGEACKDGGQFLLMCLADQASGGYDAYPKRYPPTTSQEAIRASFSDGWNIDWIRSGVCKSNEKFEDYASWMTCMTSTR